MKTRTHVGRARRALVYTLILSTTMTCALSRDASAMLAPTKNAIPMDAQAYDRATSIKEIQTALESKIVRKRLKALGLSDQEIESRISRLSDEQVHRLAKDVRVLSAGGEVVGILGAVVLILLIVFLLQRI